MGPSLSESAREPGEGPGNAHRAFLVPLVNAEGSGIAHEYTVQCTNRADYFAGGGWICASPVTAASLASFWVVAGL